MIPVDMLVTKSIAAHGNDAGEGNGERPAGGRDTRQEPGNFFGVCEGEDEFVNHAVDAYGA